MRIKVIFLRAAVGCITPGPYFQRSLEMLFNYQKHSAAEEKTGRAQTPLTLRVCVCVITATSAILHSQMSTTRSRTPGSGILYSEMQLQLDWKNPSPHGKQAANPLTLEAVEQKLRLTHKNLK